MFSAPMNFRVIGILTWAMSLSSICYADGFLRDRDECVEALIAIESSPAYISAFHKWIFLPEEVHESLMDDYREKELVAKAMADLAEDELFFYRLRRPFDKMSEPEISQRLQALLAAAYSRVGNMPVHPELSTMTKYFRKGTLLHFEKLKALQKVLAYSNELLEYQRRFYEVSIGLKAKRFQRGLFTEGPDFADIAAERATYWASLKGEKRFRIIDDPKKLEEIKKLTEKLLAEDEIVDSLKSILREHISFLRLHAIYPCDALPRWLQVVDDNHIFWFSPPDEAFGSKRIKHAWQLPPEP